ncbi:MAG: hypothetical protein L0Z54_01820 [Thermoplasmata archaeon]|nr:hypothetical protein [Thermoplasmata archaeon]
MSVPGVVPLSTNEQTVLYQLVRCPTLSDQEICSRIDMKQSTFSTIKKKLREEGYFYTSYLPMFQHLGCELLVVWYLTLNRKTRTEDRLALTRGPLLAANDLYTILSESNQAIVMSVSRNIAEHVRVSDELVQLYEANDFLESLHYVLFPFDVSGLCSFFDFAPLLNRIFDIPDDPGVNAIDITSEPVRCRVRTPEMNDLEKEIFLGLVRYPEMSDSALSERIGCSRPVLSRVKGRFLEERLLERRRIVSLEKMGFQILTMTHSRFNPLKPMMRRQVCMQETRRVLTPIFHVARDPESVMLCAFWNFEDFKHLHNEYVSFCEEQDSLVEEPYTLAMSIPRLFEVKWLVFEPLARQVLEGL